MRAVNILGAVFLTIFPFAYMMSMLTVGGFSDTYDEFCEKIECPNTENLDFDPKEVYKKAQLMAIIFGFGLIGSIWIFFFVYDRRSDKKPISKDALGVRKNK